MGRQAIARLRRRAMVERLGKVLVVERPEGVVRGACLELCAYMGRLFCATDEGVYELVDGRWVAISGYPGGGV